MTTRREIRNLIDSLSNEHDSDSRSLQQEIPHGLIEEWEQHSGNSMQWLREAEP